MELELMVVANQCKIAVLSRLCQWIQKGVRLERQLDEYFLQFVGLSNVIW